MPQSHTTMRVALFHATLPEPGRKLGGVELSVHRLANALVEKADCDVTVFSLSARPRDACYRHHQLFPRWHWLRRSRLGRLLVLPLLLNFTCFGEIDLLHLHGDDWFYLCRPRLSLRTFHGSALWEARTATSWKRRLAQYLVFPLEKLSARLCRVSLVVGGTEPRLYRSRHRVDMGVDCGRFYPGPKSPSPRILFVGTWNGRKRGRYLYELFLRDILPYFPAAELCMVSDYCPTHPCVIVEKFPSDAALAQRYREAWVFAYPSLYEGFGIPYAEALASGTAIVCSPNTGADYVLEQGRYGVIAEEGQFASRLRELLTDSARRDALAQQGLTRATAFSWPVVAAQHREIYQQALRGKGI